ncbi:hypothetical protein [Bacillus cereus]|uniref:hypothetical protein n=1 Tax=Bacillus cereus TaxID=1396 RepID=UPI000B4B8FF5|nr:hypothetical protein [Bacillus cereus]
MTKKERPLGYSLFWYDVSISYILGIAENTFYNGYINEDKLFEKKGLKGEKGEAGRERANYICK